jgi:HlyD family secretion protein
MTDHPARVWPVRRHIVIGALALLALLVGFGAWAVSAQIAGALITSGQIEVDRNRQVVQHPDGGVVIKIAVDEGDIVQRGDLLVRLDPSTLQSELTVVEGQLFEILARQARLEAERDGMPELAFGPVLLQGGSPHKQALMAGQERLFTARVDAERSAVAQLSLQRAQIADQLDGVSAQKAAWATQRSLIAQELRDQQILLDRGLAQASRVLALQREAASISGSVGALSAQAAQASERMTEVDLQILALGSTRRTEAISQLRDLQFSVLELSERRRTLKRQLSLLDIRAPVSGIVYGLRIFALQSVLRPADPLLFIIPQDRPLVIATPIAITDVDKTFVGQNVTLRFSAFDQKQTPELQGTVTLVSADAFQDQTAGSAFYRAEIRLNAGQLTLLPPNTTLIPGMPVEVFIRTADRRPIDFLIKPFTDYFTKAFREP